MWLLGEPAAKKQGADGEKQDCLRVEALSSCFMIMSHLTSLIKHKFKNKIIKNFKMAIAEH